MDTAIVRQFLDFFQEFLNLCCLDNWPENSTTEEEINNAFLISIHIGKCLDKLQEKGLINEFLSTLNSHQDDSKLFLKHCFSDPPKYILKKIIQSNTKIDQMDVGFKVFLELFPEQKLEKYLANIMVETASQETLLRNLSAEISKDNLVQFKSNILLSELSNCDDSKAFIKTMLQEPTQDTVELVVASLANKEYKYFNSVNNIVNAVLEIMSKKSSSDKKFWKFLLGTEEKYFLKLCLFHCDIFKLIVSGLLDSGRLLKENMSATYFYIDLTYSELVSVVRKICKDDNLKVEFLDMVRGNGHLEFWENML